MMNIDLAGATAHLRGWIGNRVSIEIGSERAGPDLAYLHNLWISGVDVDEGDTGVERISVLLADAAGNKAGQVFVEEGLLHRPPEIPRTGVHRQPRGRRVLPRSRGVRADVARHRP